MFFTAFVCRVFCMALSSFCPRYSFKTRLEYGSETETTADLSSSPAEFPSFICPRHSFHSFFGFLFSLTAQLYYYYWFTTFNIVTITRLFFNPQYLILWTVELLTQYPLKTTNAWFLAFLLEFSWVSYGISSIPSISCLFIFLPLS